MSDCAEQRRVVVLVGTRPEAIKLAPVIRALQDHPRFTVLVVLTGQHTDLVRPMIEHFALPVDINLNAMTVGQRPLVLLARLLERIDGALADLLPDYVLVQGDTTTAYAGALASAYWQIPVGHIEAGLRTGSLCSPFPEEMHRCGIAVVTDLHFAPTGCARDNLLREGVDPDRILVTGNTGIDALRLESERQLAEGTNGPTLAALDAQLGHARAGRPIVLATIHRRESFGEPMRRICMALRELAERHLDRMFVVPVHPNPQVSATVSTQLSGLPNLRLVEPLSYPAFVAAMRHACAVITDSGGVQEEAPSLGRPTIVVREASERLEAQASGLLTLSGFDQNQIIAAGHGAIARDVQVPAGVLKPGPFGDGFASARVLERLEARLPSMHPTKESM